MIDGVVGGQGGSDETRVSLKVEVAMEDGRNSLVDDGTSREVLHASDRVSQRDRRESTMGKDVRQFGPPSCRPWRRFGCGVAWRRSRT